MGFPGGSDGKESDCNAGGPGLIPDWEDTLENRRLPTSIYLSGEVHGQRRLVGCSQPMGLQRVRPDLHIH